MRLSAEVLGANNVEHCRKLWGDGALHSSSELDRTIATTRTLLAEGRARGSLLRDDGWPRYFGLTVFVDRASGAALMTDPHPRIGASLLADPSRAILSSDAIGRGNADDGLHLVVVGQGWDFSGVVGNPWPQLLGSILKEFEDVHAGYQLSAITGEVFGDGGHVIRTCGAFPNVREFAVAGRGVALPSLVYWITRYEAEIGFSTLLPMFSYSVPQVLFTPQEQRMLRHALCGATDAELALRLGASVTSIKSQWRRVFDRAAAVVDDALVDADCLGSGTRGMQKRHLVLDYLRRHPEELTPYERRRRPRAATRSSSRAGDRPVVPYGSARRAADQYGV